jgi:hypothetical protein
MIEKILNKFGYVKAPLDPLYEAAKVIGDPNEYEVHPKLEQQIFDHLSSVEGLAEYLRATMAKDMQRAFSSTPDQSQIIHGAFARTSYLLSRIKDTRANK